MCLCEGVPVSWNIGVVLDDKVRENIYDKK